MILRPEKNLRLNRMNTPERREGHDFLTKLREVASSLETGRFPESEWLQRVIDFIEEESQERAQALSGLPEVYLRVADHADRLRGRGMLADLVAKHLQGTGQIALDVQMQLLVGRLGLGKTLTLCGIAGKQASAMLDVLHRGRLNLVDDDEAADESAFVYDHQTGLWEKENAQGRREPCGPEEHLADIFAETRAGSLSEARRRFELLRLEPWFYDSQTQRWRDGVAVDCQAVILEALWDRDAARAAFDRTQELRNNAIPNPLLDLWALLAEEVVTDSAPPVHEIIPDLPLKKAV